MSRFFVLLSFVFLFETNLFAKSWEVKSEVKQVALIELYSSEGCSSCPPADRWVAGLKGHEKLFKEFIPLNFHVDYWNYLGWTDRFSNESFSRRQRHYASEWKKGKVYTPGFVLNGKEWRTRQLQNLLGSPVGVLKAKKGSQNQYEISFHPVNKKIKIDQVHVALLGNDITTQVKAGENRGATLRHEYVVLKTNVADMKKMGDDYLGTISLPTSQNREIKKHSIVFWVTRSGSQKPIQAVGGYLAKYP